MQQHAGERQDGQTTLGPQSFLRRPGPWHCQSLKPDSGGRCTGEGGQHSPNATQPCLCPRPCLESQTEEGWGKGQGSGLSRMSWTLFRWHLSPSVPLLLSLLHLHTHSQLLARCQRSQRQAKMLLPPLPQIRTTQADCDRHQKLVGHMVWKLTRARFQVAVFSASEAQWLNSLTIIGSVWNFQK